MQGLCAEKNTIGPLKRLIAALYSRSPTKNSRIVITVRALPYRVSAKQTLFRHQGYS